MQQGIKEMKFWKESASGTGTDLQLLPLPWGIFVDLGMDGRLTI